MLYLLRHSHVPEYELDWLAGIIVIHGLDLINKFNLMVSDKKKNWIWSQAIKDKRKDCATVYINL